VLVGGPTGSGKSTTLAAIIDYINRTSRRHVISIEDPIEVVHKSETGLVNQREVGVHTPSFDQALRMTLREDPDVILVGEMRDLPTIQFAVTAAETGHLVFGTVHTVSADTSVDRLINAYPPESQEQVRSMLADSLRAVLCQYLIRHKERNERLLAYELMMNNHAIANLIRKGKTFQIPSVIATSKELHMQLMDNSLMDLFKQGKITAEDAYLKASNKADFEEIMGIKKDKQAAGAANAAAQTKREQGR
jgi:twitching motility protein PilT